MKVVIKVPRGWRSLKSNEVLKTGDMFPHGQGYWYPVRHSVGLERGEMFPVIRKRSLTDIQILRRRLRSYARSIVCDNRILN